MPPSRTIFIKDIGPVLLERSRKAKRMNISIRPFKGIRVAVPRGVSYTEAEQFAHSQKQWLLKKKGQIRGLEDKALTNSRKVEFDRKKAELILTDSIKEIAKKYGYTFNRLTIRNQKTRWGSCSGKNNISLNMKLTLLPDELRDYVILHELVHTKIKNHGKLFWEELNRVEPRAEELARKVRQYSLLVI